jgi:hypothetical protein
MVRDVLLYLFCMAGGFVPTAIAAVLCELIATEPAELQLGSPVLLSNLISSNSNRMRRITDQRDGWRPREATNEAHLPTD